MYSLAQSKSLISETTAVLRFGQISDVNDDAILVLITNVVLRTVGRLLYPTQCLRMASNTVTRRKFKHHVADAYTAAKGDVS